MSSLHCWAFAWLNDCANGDEADFTYVQTQKTQSHYCVIFVRFGYKKSLGSSFFGAWADFHWNCERSFHSFCSTNCLKITFCAINPHSTGMRVTKNSTESSNLLSSAYMYYVDHVDWMQTMCVENKPSNKQTMAATIARFSCRQNTQTEANSGRNYQCYTLLT